MYAAVSNNTVGRVAVRGCSGHDPKKKQHGNERAETIMTTTNRSTPLQNNIKEMGGKTKHGRSRQG